MKFIKLNHEGILPTRATKGSAGYDLSASSNAIIEPGRQVLIPTGIGWTDIPDFVMGDIRPRSGLASKKGIDVMAGVIDADYDKKEIKVLLRNHGKDTVMIGKGDRIAQLVMRQVITMGDIPESERTGGWGSTGQ